VIESKLGEPRVAALVAEGRRLLDSALAADAIELLGRAIAARPDDVEAARWLAEAQLVADATADARRTLDAALEIAPHDSDLVMLKAEAALKDRALGEAGALLDAALAVRPGDAALLAERARVCLHAGEPAAAIAALDRCLAIEPGNLEAQSLRILLASYDPAITTERLKALQRAWRGPPPDQPALRAERRDGPLRVGYVCCGLYRHATATVAAAVLLNHDPAKVEAYCYSGSRKRDRATMQIRMAVKGWRTIVGLDDAAAAAQIRADGIDILVDVDGHFPHNRLGVFARRAAPVQLSAWGYVAGPGTPGVDYLLTDEAIAPDAERAFFPERIVRLPCAQPYTPDLMPRPGPAAPAERAAGPIRFGCFNRLDKLTDASLALWGRILAACPDATLTLKDPFLGDPASQARVLAGLARGGAAPGQATFEAGEPHGRYLAAFDRIDVALDPFPVSGGVTTLDGISQGVAAITLAGQAPPGRITASILAYAELADGVCDSEAAYLQQAVALARDPARLADLRRRTLAARARFSASAMRHYTAEVEAAYAEIWARRLAAPPLA